MGLTDFFFARDKDALRGAMQYVLSKTKEISLDIIYCRVDGRGEKFVTSFWCKCSDPYLTGYSMNGSYQLLERRGFLVKEAAQGFMTEQVFSASRVFRESTFFLFDGRRFKYPSAIWEEPPLRIYRCMVCGTTQTEREVDWADDPPYLVPACNKCDGETERLK
jgi:hypothetical protein